MANTSPGPTRTEVSASHHSAGSDQALSADSTLRIGVLSPHNSKETKAILNAVRSLGHEPVWIRDENVASWIEDGNVRLSPAVDVLINRLLLTKSAQPLEDLQLAALYEEIAPVLNHPTAVQNALHKYRAGAQLAAADLPVPDAYFGRSPRAFEEWRKHLPSTAAHKRTIGTNGGLMSVVSQEETVNPRIKNTQAFVQEFLESERERPYDVRVYVVGGRVLGAMRRHAPDGDWRTNVALGGEVEDVTDDLDGDVRETAVRAVDALDLDVAGVDVIGTESDPYVLEVNATAGFKGLFEATGRNPAPYIAQSAIERAGGTVDESRVVELSATLDDSIPACKPRPTTGSGGEATIIGYTEEVVVSGTTGSETVTAKSDTGAARTSIDTKVAAAIGAGPIQSMTRVKSGSRKSSKSRPVVDVVIGVGGHRHTVSASIEDRSHMDYPVLLGRDVLENYQVDITRRSDRVDEREE